MTTKPRFTNEFAANAAVIAWAAEAARQEVTRARFRGEEPSTTTCMGLWQSFQAEFPKDRMPSGNYDLYLHVYNGVFTATVEAIVKAFEEEKVSKKIKADARAARKAALKEPA